MQQAESIHRVLAIRQKPARSEDETLRLGPRVTHARVAAIVALEAEPVRRNYLITQAYADISRDFRDVLGIEHANWCTFAAWASATAGNFIRGDLLPQFMLAGLREDEKFSRKLRELLAQDDACRASNEVDFPSLVQRLALDVATKIARGNLKVFEELAPVFVEMISLFSGGRTPSPREVRAHFESRLSHGPSSLEGQTRLLMAVESYAAAKAATDENARAHAMLYANALVGFHEQIRLQPAICGGVDAPFDFMLEQAVRLASKMAKSPRGQQFTFAMLKWAVEKPLRFPLELARNWYRDLLTDAMMTMRVPGKVIRLGWDVVYPPGGLPPALRIEEIQSSVELSMLLEAYNTFGNGEEDCGARDWTKVTDRMHFIIDLFRSHQLEASFFGEPLSDDDRARLSHGELPAEKGILDIDFDWDGFRERRERRRAGPQRSYRAS